MKKIWKQTIDLRKLTASDSSIMQELPQQARIVHAAISPASGLEDLLDFWFEFTCDYTSHQQGVPPTVEFRRLYVFGTGHPIPDGLHYCATAVGTQFVWHLYERPRVT
jgi:hypothetical protein